MGAVTRGIVAIAAVVAMGACSIERLPESAVWFERLDVEPYQLDVSSDGDLILMGFDHSVGTNVLTRRSREDGHVVWRTPLPQDFKAARVDPSGDIFINSRTGGLRRYAASTGNLVSENPSPFFLYDWKAGHGLLVGYIDSGRLTLVDAETLLVVWTDPDLNPRPDLGAIGIAANGDVFELTGAGLARRRKLDGSVAWRNERAQARFLTPLADGGAVIAIDNVIKRVDQDGLIGWTTQPGPSFEACCEITGLAATGDGAVIVPGNIGYAGNTRPTTASDGSFDGFGLSDENDTFVAQLSASDGTTRTVGQVFQVLDLPIAAGPGPNFYLSGGRFEHPDSFWIAAIEH